MKAYFITQKQLNWKYGLDSCALKRVSISMVRFCCVRSCSSNSIGELMETFTFLSLSAINFSKKSLLKQWVHAIWMKNLSINSNTRVCSKRFINASGRQLKLDEDPSLYLPVLFTCRVPTNERNWRRNRLLVIHFPNDSSSPADSSTVTDNVHVVEVCTQTEESFLRLRWNWLQLVEQNLKK